MRQIKHDGRTSQSCFSWYATWPQQGKQELRQKSLSPALAGMRLGLEMALSMLKKLKSQSCFSWYATCPSLDEAIRELFDVSVLL